MKFLNLTVLLFGLRIVHARQGRECNVCPDCLPNQGGFYVSWPETTRAAGDWCRAHAGQVVSHRKSIDDGDIGGYKSNKWNVKLHGKNLFVQPFFFASIERVVPSEKRSHWSQTELTY